MSEPLSGGRGNTAAWLRAPSREPTTPAASKRPVTIQLERQLRRIRVRITPIPTKRLARWALAAIVTCRARASVTENNSQFLRQGHAHRRPGADRHASGACRGRQGARRTDRRDRGLPGAGGPGGAFLPRPYAADGGYVRTARTCLRLFHLRVLALPQRRDGGGGSAARGAAARARARGRDQGPDLGAGPALPGDAHRPAAERDGSLRRCALAREAARAPPAAAADRPQRAHRGRLCRRVGAPSVALLRRGLALRQSFEAPDPGSCANEAPALSKKRGFCSTLRHLRRRGTSVCLSARLRAVT